MTECKKWQGEHTVNGRPVSGKAFVYRTLYRVEHPDESIKGLDIHHECGSEWCIEVSHLTAMYRSDHTKLHAQLRREAQTHCVNDHEWTDENTDYVIDKDGYRNRRCRSCRLLRQAEYRAKNYVQPTKKQPPTHCVHGHEYNEENSAYKKSDGSRYCRECNRVRSRENQRILREAKAAL